MKHAGSDAAAAARERAQSGLEQGKSSASAMAGDTADALQTTADDLAAKGQEGLAQAAARVSEELSKLSRGLEQRSVDELTRDARDLARNNPALFVAGSVGLGLALSRFFKASPSPRSTSTTAGSSAGPARAARSSTSTDNPGATNV